MTNSYLTSIRLDMGIAVNPKNVSYLSKFAVSV